MKTTSISNTFNHALKYTTVSPRTQDSHSILAE